MKKHAITPEKFNSPGPFSAGIEFGNLIFISGQVGRNPASGALAGDDIESQTEQVFTNLQSVLEAAGATFNDAVRVGVYLTDMSHFARMNAVYAKYFSLPYPARTTIGVASLPLGAIVEIDMWVGKT
jgi:2-iminobutanoate/2-iminopropanoate deaminase